MRLDRTSAQAGRDIVPSLPTVREPDQVPQGTIEPVFIDDALMFIPSTLGKKQDIAKVLSRFGRQDEPSPRGRHQG